MYIYIYIVILNIIIIISSIIIVSMYYYSSAGLASTRPGTPTRATGARGTPE